MPVQVWVEPNRHSNQIKTEAWTILLQGPN